MIPPRVQISTLPNGLRIATAEMPHLASVSLGIWVGIGARYEPAALNGACHFIEHMLFKGTRRRSAREISQAVEGIGGYLNAFTSEEMTCIHSRARADRFDELLDVLVDMLVNSKFAPGDVTKEREVILEEVAMYRDQPQQHVQELLNAQLWPDQPLGRTITGDEKSLAGLTRGKLRDWMQRNYLPANTLFVVAGRVKHRAAVRAVARYAKRFQPGTPPHFTPVQISQHVPGVHLCTRKTEQAQLALGFRTCSRHDPRRYALRLLNTILGENMSSRLFQVVREDRGLAYSIYSSVSHWADCGDFVVSAGLDTANLEPTLGLILRELHRLATTPPTSSELGRARDYLIGQIDLGLESTDNQMNWLGEQLLGHGRVFSPAETKRRLAAVGALEIRAVAREFFRPERASLALVSPLKSGARLGRLLKSTPCVR